MDPYALSLVIEFPDGGTQRWGPDELSAADVPTGLRFGTSMPGGYRDLACALLRRVDVARTDERTFATVTVYDNAAQIVWRGRFRQFPRKHGAEYVVEPGAEGWVAHLQDRKDARALYRDVGLQSWQEASTTRRNTALAAAYQDLGAGSVRPDDTTPAFSQALGAYPSGTPKSYLEAWYDARGLPIGSLYYAWRTNTDLSADANWYWRAYLSTDLLLTTSDTSGNLRAAGPGSGTVTATDTRRYAMVQFLYDSTGGLTLRRVLDWKNLAVMGDHGLTLRGTEPDAGYYLSDLVEHAVSTFAPRLNTDDVEANTVVLGHAQFLDPTTAADMVQTFNRVALWDYGVYGRERFFFRQSDPDRLTWKVRLDEGTTLDLDGPTGDEQINGVSVFYTDPTGRQLSVGPPGALVDSESSTLLDTTADNPANVAGLQKWDALSLSDPVDEDTALLIGQVYLAQRSVPQRRGRMTVTGMAARHPTKGPRPVFEIRAGDYVQVVDSNDDVLGAPRRVVDTDYDHDRRAISLDLDNRPDTLESLLAVLNAEMVRGGF